VKRLGSRADQDDKHGAELSVSWAAGVRQSFHAVQRIHTSIEWDAFYETRRHTLVIPVSDIFLACHLVPKFHMLDKELKLTAYTDLFALSNNFWLNHYYNHYFYQLVQHWRRHRPRKMDRLWQHVR
ncbi:hypothetical protein FRC10_003907, partial [Ceratobasidium sp. 414]